MIESTVGPYKVLSELGSGGMGTVYLAEVAEQTPVLDQGQRVALKIVHPHLLATPGFFKRFLLEGEVGKKIHHENVVRTFDVDATLHEDKQVNYMVMEYVEGKSLRELLLELRVVPESLLREVALQIADGLAAVHAENIVHRDLKPENVLITADHQVRIMDLGVAKLQEASIALTKEGQFTGSLLYASPEQCESREVGPLSDLYAMGVMLYELATGKNPFRRDDAVGIIKAHIAHEPQRASDLNPDVSRFFTEVIATLLEKDAAKRFPTAAELREVLREAENSEWWAERERHLHTVIAELPPIQVRRETELHGRENEMKALTEAWEQAKQGEGRVVYLEGEAGLGKTRLVDVFLRSLASEDTHILYGSYPPSGGLGGLSDAMLGKFGSAGMEENLAPYMDVTPTLIPAFTALIRHESPPTGSEPMQGDALHAVVCNIMRALAAEKPTIWIIEDLQFAPADSRNLLLSMARAVGPHRVLLIATARDLPESDLVHVSRLPHYRRIQLGRLGARDVIELLQDAFGSAVLAEKLGGKIAYKSDGVPFFVFEMIRGLRDGHFLKQNPDGSYVQTQMITDIEVPSAVRDLIEARLKEVSDDDRALLDVAAVQGYEFDADLIARVRELKKVQVLERLAALERRHGVIKSGAGTSRFDHYQLQEILYRDLMPELREEYHALLGDAFIAREELDPEDADGDEAYFVARHHLRGSRPKSALPHLQRAFDYLVGACQNEVAVELARRALNRKRLVRGADRVAWLLRVAHGFSVLGRSADQRAAIDEAIECAEKAGDAKLVADAKRALGSLFWTLARYDEALAVLNETKSTESPEAEAQACLSAAPVLFDLGRHEEGLRELEHAQSILGENSTAQTWLGYGSWLIGDYARRMAHHTRALEIAHGSMRLVPLHNLGNVMADLGHFEESSKYQKEANKMAREAGFRRFEGHTCHSLGELQERRGNLDRAKDRYEEARGIFADVGHRNREMDSLTCLGRVKAREGQEEEAADLFDAAVAVAVELNLPGKALLPLAWRTTLPGGELDRTLEAFENRGVKTACHEDMEARFLLWKATEDRTHLEEAHRLLERLVDHAPEDYRESMVQNVPLNRDIVAAWEEHGA